MSSQGTLPPAKRRCRLLLAGARHDTGNWHRIGQRQFVDLPRQLIQPDQQAGHVGGTGGLDAVDVTGDRGTDAGKPGLPRALQALVGAAQRSQQRLVLPVACACCCARRRAASISTSMFSSRGARHALHQLFNLRALQRHLAEPGIRQRLAGGGFPRQLLRLPGHAAASIALLPASALCRASCSWMFESFCHSMPLTTSDSAVMATNTYMTPRGTAAPSRAGTGDCAAG
jgi:hypothetical protein